MAENKRSFVLYVDIIHTIQKLPKDKAGKLFLTILKYVNGDNPVVDDLIVDLVFEQIRRDIDSFNNRNNPGALHWNWKGGISPKNQTIRNGAEIKHWRTLVFTRDKYTCRKCKKKGGTLHAHHILSFSTYPEFRFDVNNGLTLCKKCHHKIHSKNG